MPRTNAPAMVNGQEITTTYLTRADRCEYCGRPGCHWSLHAEARADVRAIDPRTVERGGRFADDPDHTADSEADY